MNHRIGLSLALPLAWLALAGAPRTAHAQETDESIRDAGRHFQRGVALYGEADYRAALIEFKRAYSIAPNAAVLYNVGETQYQMQDYAGALTTFEHYLDEAPPADAHRTDVEASVPILRARVGHLMIATVPAGADVSVDDQPIGRTPLDRPSLLVSVGRRKVTAAVPGRPAMTRFVDVAAEDNAAVVLQLAPAAEAATVPAPRTGSSAPVATRTSAGSIPWFALGWSGTGALAAGAVSFGLVALKESNDLKTQRASYPVSAGVLQHDASLVTTYSAVADTLAVAATIAGGVTLLSALATPSRPRAGADPTVRFSVGLAAAHLRMDF